MHEDKSDSVVIVSRKLARIVSSSGMYRYDLLALPNIFMIYCLVGAQRIGSSSSGGGVVNSDNDDEESAGAAIATDEARGAPSSRSGSRDYDVISVGELVEVERRKWPGINKNGNCLSTCLLIPR